MDNLWSILERNTRNFPKSIAVRYPAKKQTLTWLELRNGALDLAATLNAKGVGKGDRVAILFHNCPEFIYAFFAIAYMGAVVVPVNIKLTVPEINYILQNSEATALLFTEEKRETAEAVIKQTGVKILLSGSEFSSRDTGRISYVESGYADSLDLAEILYTSGTTGQPKGVMLSHYAIISTGQMMAYESQIYHQDNVLLLMPLTHSAPLNLFLVGACWAGAQVTLGEFSPQTLAQMVVEERTTHFFGAPVAYQFLLRIPNIENCDLSSMKYWIYGGAPTGEEPILAWQKVLPGRFMSVYGLTEAGPNGLALRNDEHADKAGSIGGRGSINAEVKVLRQDGTNADVGEAGEISLKTPSMMLGYYKKPEETKGVLRDGWLLTGDLAIRDEDGYLWILDRKKDMIISGGVNVYPKEVEDLLMTHPRITDAAVIGVPHPDWGESVCAVLTLNEGEDLTLANIREFCQGRLADYKIPKLMRVLSILPRNSSGKLLKYHLRKDLS
ncbi:class I adenylate-forming enzyme family protein [Desulfitobacterium sp.]|uniref:class I adenylate-forming enzyme family protein n=1 Tax=Desulfitobacterium sp. TaxID=49981 RepID=UPI002B9FD92B|nr:AMP-binding protein [Desulfitobacterium sp.]HVJ50235.1 AMP-binding protein [Desulfitobacterium sp.]